MKFLYPIFLLFSVHCFCQPVLTDTDNNFVLGDSFVIASSMYLPEGPSGPNQFWDFSTMDSNGVEYYSVMNPVNTPSGNFCNSDVSVWRTGMYDLYYYWNISPVNSECVGVSYLSQNYIYSNSELYLSFPLTYLDTITDNYGYTASSSTIIGTIEKTVDGYGTIITPAGIFNNVLRIHTVQTAVDSATGNTNTTYDNYSWWTPGIHFFVAMTGKVITTSSVGYSSSYLRNPIVTGIKESKKKDIRLYPNPCNSYFTVSLQSQPEIVRILTVDGKDVTNQVVTTQCLNGNITIITESLSPGIYFLDISTSDDRLSEIISVCR